MGLLTTCPGCGNQRVNNDEDCPFCGYSVKLQKTKEQMDREAEALEAAREAEERAKEEAEERARAEAEAKARAEAEAKARAEAEAAAQAKAAAEAKARAEAEARAKAAAEAKAREEAEAAAAAKGSGNIFAQFKYKQNASARRTNFDEGIIGVPDLPDLPVAEDGSGNLPPMMKDRPVSVAEIANTPAVKLTPIEGEKLTSTLPPMQPEREVTIQQIQQTPAVKLSPIKAEEIENKLPDINSPEAAPPESFTNRPDINVEQKQAQKRQINYNETAYAPQPPVPRLFPAPELPAGSYRLSRHLLSVSDPAFGSGPAFAAQPPLHPQTP